MQKVISPEGSSRRAMLKGLAAGAALPVLGQNPPPENRHKPGPVTKQEATPYHYRCFNAEEARALDALAETIIPADEHSPGAKAARVAEYLDLIIADAGNETQQLWKRGIAAANELAQNSFGRAYADCSGDEQVAILSEIAGGEDPHGSPDERFFCALKRATVDGYYTSKIGIHDDLQYQGNQAVHDFPGCARTGMP